MKSLNKKFCLFLSILAVLFLYFGIVLNGRLFFWGVRFEGVGAFMVNLQKDVVIAHNKKFVILVKRKKTDDNKRIIDSKVGSLMNLYKPAASPYSEAITNILGCDTEFWPVEIAIENGKAFSLFANERMSFGVCSTDLIKYKAAYGVFDCGVKGVFEVGVFSQSDGAEEVIKKFGCRDD